MTYCVRQLTGTQERFEFARIASSAYPGFGRSPRENAEAVEELAAEPTNTFWGCFEGDRLLGGMRRLDLSMNYCGEFIDAGGLGFVAVGLGDKRRGVARSMVRSFLEHCQAQGIGMTLLYPFRPDFYHGMGFGFGQEGRLFALKPQALPHRVSPHAVRRLTDDDVNALGRCYRDFAVAHHGYCHKTCRELNALFGAKGLYGYETEAGLEGYVAFDFARAHHANALKNDLVIREWVWHNPRAFLALSSFLHSQRDQVDRVLFATQQSDFQFLSADPRNATDNMFNKHYHECYTGGVGLMYRMTSLPLLVKAIAHRNFNDMNCQLTVRVRDSFCPEHSGVYSLRFVEGRLCEAGEGVPSAIAIELDVAELSSLFMGSVEFSTLYRLGKVQVEPEAVNRLSRLFWYPMRPECVTSF